MFDDLFKDVVSGLAEYYSVLQRPEITAALRTVLSPTFQPTGNTQADYEALRDQVERLVQGESMQVISRLTQRVIEQAFGPLDALHASVAGR